MASAAQQAPVLPISELSTYQSRWTIKAKVTSKPPMRTFKKGANGEGKVFSVDLCDRDGGEIRASFFNDAAAKFDDILKVGKVYTFSRGGVKVANKQYNQTNHRYELTFEKDAQIAEDASTDTFDIDIKYNFVDLRAVQSKQLPCRIDLCGVITESKPISSLTAKDGRELTKRDITIADDTATSMQVTLWGDKGKLPDSDYEGNPVIALKGILIKEFNGGRNGSTSEAAVVSLRPDMPEAKRLEQWWSQGGGSTQSLVSLRGTGGGGKNLEQCTVSEMRRKSEQVGEQAEFYGVTARLSTVQTRKQGEQVPLHYSACAIEKEGQYGKLACNRRVDASGFCAACNMAGKTAIRLNTRCRFADFADGCWLTTFDEAAQVVLSLSSEKVAEIDGVECAGREQLEMALKQNYFLDPLQLKVRAKLDMYMGEPRPNVSCVGAAPVNRRKHGRKLLSEIQQMLA